MQASFMHRKHTHIDYSTESSMLELLPSLYYPPHIIMVKLDYPILMRL